MKQELEKLGDVLTIAILLAASIIGICCALTIGQEIIGLAFSVATLSIGTKIVKEWEAREVVAKVGRDEKDSITPQSD